ncbi:pentatricopeptide repeat-containing protein At5g66520-like [Solanum stenotomum]|uniref:pentatricopeptide repeat-containing protein At5g66520-like n=1 Tax=Solanum stenotomum TaxID=172797 RepID=UPI0020D1A551|nr:pentatricopeptide repeat-containing protein At5g66520-like [Solanum stenotomum]
MGFEFDVILLTGLLDFYGKVGDLGSARKVFVEMPERDVIATNAMISAFSTYGCVEEAKQLFENMSDRNSASWNSLITCYCKSSEVHNARLIFDRNPIKDVVSWNAMIDGYCKSEQMVKADELFGEMGFMKNVVTWNTMIAGYVQRGESVRAIDLFQRMLSEEVKPTEVTMVSLLSACAHLGALDMGEWIHGYIRTKKIKIDFVLGNALIDMYFKCGNVEAAIQVFHGLHDRNIFCWNSVIIGLGMHGYGKEAVDAFIAMEREGIKPDGVTFVGLLCSCSHSGLVSVGRSYFSQMKIPNAVVWGGLLRACHKHKDAKLGEQVTDNLLRLDPHDGGNYVFLSNLYASLNRWTEVDQCRKLMIKRGVRKTPGCSSIEVKNIVYEFVAGDTSRTQINVFLDKIVKEVQAHGYEPDTTLVLHDVEDEERESVVRYHSERIAVAFGLMTMQPGRIIRVVKNLRTCDDCHTFMKFISNVYKREIIMRDRNRFHHFRNGYCSCNDYW